ncbi:MAG TPA: hypothetical protein VGI12_03940 [Vicinamibacterales bacterium]|jgi:hypothetical protein
MSSHHPHGELVNENVHHEESDINVRAIIAFVVVLAGITIGIQVAMIGLFKLFDTIETRTQPVVTPLAAGPAQVADFPAPSLQTTPWTDLQMLRASETDYLNGYGWVDESGGIARIPIDRAKAMLLQKGIPVRAGAADPVEGTHVASTGESNGGRLLKAGGADLSGAPAPAANPAVPPVNATMPPTTTTDTPRKPGGGL